MGLHLVRARLPLRLCLVTPRYCDERSFGALGSLASLTSLAAALDVRRFLVGGELSSGVALRPLPTPCFCSLSSGTDTHCQGTVCQCHSALYLRNALAGLHADAGAGAKHSLGKI